MKMEINFFWNMMLSDLAAKHTHVSEEYATCVLYHKDGYSRFCRNVGIHQTTRRHIPEDSNPQGHIQLQSHVVL